MRRTFVPLLILVLCILAPGSLLAQNIQPPEQLSPVVIQDVESKQINRVLYRPDTDKLSFRHLVYYPGVDKIKIIKPIYRPNTDKFEVHDLSFRALKPKIIIIKKP